MGMLRNYGKQPYMRSGRLKHKISIYSVTKAGGTGGETLTLFCTAWAEFRPMTGKEVQALGSTFSTLSQKITMRYIRGVKASMVAYFGGRKFVFSSVINVDEANRELQIIATESA